MAASRAAKPEELTDAIATRSTPSQVPAFRAAGSPASGYSETAIGVRAEGDAGKGDAVERNSDV